MMREGLNQQGKTSLPDVFYAWLESSTNVFHALDLILQIAPAKGRGSEWREDER
jgi:hypothetical protein